MCDAHALKKLQILKIPRTQTKWTMKERKGYKSKLNTNERENKFLIIFIRRRELSPFTHLRLNKATWKTFFYFLQENLDVSYFQFRASVNRLPKTPGQCADNNKLRWFLRNKSYRWISFEVFPECSLPSTISKSTIKIIGHHSILPHMPVLVLITRVIHPSTLHFAVAGSIVYWSNTWEKKLDR